MQNKPDSFMERYGVRTFGELSRAQREEVVRESVERVGPQVAAVAEATFGGKFTVEFAGMIEEAK